MYVLIGCAAGLLVVGWLAAGCYGIVKGSRAAGSERFAPGEAEMLFVMSFLALLGSAYFWFWVGRLMGAP